MVLDPRSEDKKQVIEIDETKLDGYFYNSIKRLCAHLAHRNAVQKFVEDLTFVKDSPLNVSKQPGKLEKVEFSQAAYLQGQSLLTLYPKLTMETFEEIYANDWLKAQLIKLY